jgi:hypothetical protein
MPHSFYDLKTGNLGLSLMQERSFAGAAWNTVRRDHQIPGEEKDADQADIEQSYFTAFSRAFLAWFDNGIIIQIHGFSREKRTTAAGETAQIIVSSGSRIPAQAAWFLDRCWERGLSLVVRVYPVEVMELGGTQNVVGQVVRDTGRDDFIHLELDYETRTMLVNQPGERHVFGQCLEEIRR